MTKDKYVLYNQLRNNIEDEFLPPELKIANNFYFCDFTEEEMVSILNDSKVLQVYKTLIHNAYRDLKNGITPKLFENAGIWANEQIHTLQMLKK